MLAPRRELHPALRAGLAIVAFAGATLGTSSLDLAHHVQAASSLRLEAIVVQAPTELEERTQVAAALAPHARTPELAQRIADAIVTEARAQRLDPALLIGILLTENTTLNPRARSFVGARGLMQVMPLHGGQWGCATPDLYDVEANICHGVRVLASLIKRAPDTETALLRYNGCVRGTNTPHCRRYPAIVLRRVERAEQQMMAAANQVTQL